MGTPRLTAQTLKVLNALMSDGSDGLSGAEIGRTAQLCSGTLYPILFRLEQAGWVRGRWERQTPEALGRPRRRLYRLTKLGVGSARSALQEFVSMIGALSWQNG